MKISFLGLKSQFNGWSFGWIKTMPLISQLYLGTILKNNGHDVEILKKYYLSFRGFKFWLGNFLDSANFWKGLKELVQQNREHPEFLKKADPR